MSKKGLIFETLNDVKSMSREKSNDGFMHLSGVFGVCGVKNNNQRVYETKNYAKMVESMQERLKKAPIPGELEHPTTMNITTENISHRIDSINIDENGVVSGEITLLNTPKGKIAQAIVEGGLPLFISSRATGQVDRNGYVTLETLQTYDLVGSPGFSQAELHLNENQTCESICESICFVSDCDPEACKAEESGAKFADPNCPVEAGGEGHRLDGREEEIKKEKENKLNKHCKENNIEYMDNETLKQIQESIEEMQSQIEYLEEQNKMLQEQLDSKQDFDLEQIANGIQKWVVEEFAPEVQNWLTEEYSDKVQKWVVEEFAPEVQNWVVEEYSPEVQNWIVGEYSQGIQGWMTEHVIPEVNENLQTTIAESLKSTKSEKLQSIDSVLSMLENHQTTKPVYGRKAEMLNEDVDEPKYIREMPVDKRVQWNMASKDVRENVERRAKLYDFSKEGAIQNFWESVDLTQEPQIKNINEGLDDVQDIWEKNIRKSIRSFRARH